MSSPEESSADDGLTGGEAQVAGDSIFRLEDSYQQQLKVLGCPDFDLPDASAEGLKKWRATRGALSIVATLRQMTLTAEELGETDEEMLTEIKQGLQASLISEGFGHAWWQVVDETFSGISLPLGDIDFVMDRVADEYDRQAYYNAEVQRCSAEIGEYLGSLAVDRSSMVRVIAANLVYARLRGNILTVKFVEKSKLLVLAELGPSPEWMAMIDHVFAITNKPTDP